MYQFSATIRELKCTLRIKRCAPKCSSKYYTFPAATNTGRNISRNKSHNKKDTNMIGNPKRMLAQNIKKIKSDLELIIKNSIKLKVSSLIFNFVYFFIVNSK